MNYLELVAAVLGAISVWLVVRRNIWAFPIGIVMVALYALIFFEAKLYSDMLLQVFFAVMQIHGWLEWRRGERADDEKIAVRRLSAAQWAWTGCLQLLGFAALGYAMDTCTDAASPYMDAFVTIESVLAQWWMNKRYVENWVLWIAVDQVAVFLYASKSLWFTTVLYAIFLAMAIVGYIEWQRKLKAADE